MHRTHAHIHADHAHAGHHHRDNPVSPISPVSPLSPVTARTPFHAAGTPPATPQRAPRPSTLAATPRHDYPESPTSPRHASRSPRAPDMRGAHAGPAPVPPALPAFTLGQIPAGKRRGSGSGSGSGSALLGPGGLPLAGAPRPAARRRRQLGLSVPSTRRALHALFALLVLALVGRLAYLRLRMTSIPARIKRFGQDGYRRLAEAALGTDDDDDAGELCRFVSPVDAYHRDLARLRARFAGEPGAQADLDARANASAADVVAAVERALAGAAGAAGAAPRSGALGGHSASHAHHLFSPTGHLLVADARAGAPHPIPALLTLGEKRWEDVLARQSRSLADAVREYRRRYGRRPPRGFDAWWAFAEAHALVLPDEYDRINLDLAPFWALPKAEMKKRMEWVEDMKETFTITVQNGAVDIEDEGALNWGGTWFRALDAASLIKSFASILPDLRATFSIFDQPQIYLSWARRSSLVDLGLRGQHTSHLLETDDAHVRLSRSCSPDSNFRTNNSMSFIYDSEEAGDFCQMPLHGLTIERHEPDSHPMPHTQLLPLFSLAKTSINSDILITPLEQFADNPGKDPKWEDKTDDRLAWRGSPTGIAMMTDDVDWRNSHRVRLHRFANNASDEEVAFIVPDLGQPREAAPAAPDAAHDGARSLADRRPAARQPLRFREERLATREANDFFFDVKLAGGPIQCSADDGTCGDLGREIDWAGYQSPAQLNRHKFLFDIDGNGWSGRFRRLMSTNSVVVKSSLFTEWYAPHLVPWFMYIPSKLDFSDLVDILAFFRGSPQNPELAFDETAKALGKNGRMFRMEDLQAYMMRLFLEYARIAADEGEDMDFYFEDEDEMQEEVPLDVMETEQPADEYAEEVTEAAEVAEMAGTAGTAGDAIEPAGLGAGAAEPIDAEVEMVGEVGGAMGEEAGVEEAVWR